MRAALYIGHYRLSFGTSSVHIKVHLHDGIDLLIYLLTRLAVVMIYAAKSVMRVLGQRMIHGVSRCLKCGIDPYDLTTHSA